MPCITCMPGKGMGLIMLGVRRCLQEWCIALFAVTFTLVNEGINAVAQNLVLS